MKRAFLAAILQAELEKTYTTYQGRTVHGVRVDWYWSYDETENKQEQVVIEFRFKNTTSVKLQWEQVELTD